LLFCDLYKSSLHLFVSPDGSGNQKTTPFFGVVFY
jgi:hypothetical protein